jgi:hypothetical protein
VLLAGAAQLAPQWPEMLGYYNRASGGPERAWKRFADSNSDWGHLRQGGLAVLRERHGASFEVLRRDDGPRFGRVALYVDDLVRPDPRDPSRSYSWLDAFAPLDHVGAAWFLFEVSASSFAQAIEAGGDPRLHRDLAVALLGAGRIDEALGAADALDADERSAVHQLAALLRAARGTDTDAESALELSARWSAFERHDRAEAALRELRLDADPVARMRLIEQLVKQRRLDEAIAILEGDAELLAKDDQVLLLFVLYDQVARYADAIALLRPRLATCAPTLRAELDAKLRDLERLRELGERYHRPLR